MTGQRAGDLFGKAGSGFTLSGKTMKKLRWYGEFLIVAQNANYYMLTKMRILFNIKLVNCYK